MENMQLVQDALSTIEPLDYEIVDTFFHMLLTQYSINLLRMPKPEVNKATKALKKRYDINEEKPITQYISKFAFSVLFADCCGSLKSFTAQNNGPGAWGVIKGAINLTEDDLTCRSRTQLIMQRKGHRTTGMLHRRLCEEAYNDGDTRALTSLVRRVGNLPTEETQLRFRNQPDCGSIPLRCIFGLGNIIQITELKIPKTLDNPITNAFAFCYSCGSLSAFSPHMYGANGFECTACDIFHNLENYTPNCVCCAQKIKADKPPHSFMVIDNRPEIGSYSHKKLFVCDRCYRVETSNFHKSGLFSANDLIASKYHRTEGMEWIRAIRNGEQLDGPEPLFTEGANHKKRRVTARKLTKRRMKVHEGPIPTFSSASAFSSSLHDD
jgi:hypothetical protein